MTIITSTMTMICLKLLIKRFIVILMNAFLLPQTFHPWYTLGGILSSWCTCLIWWASFLNVCQVFPYSYNCCLFYQQHFSNPLHSYYPPYPPLSPVSPSLTIKETPTASKRSLPTNTCSSQSFYSWLWLD